MYVLQLQLLHVTIHLFCKIFLKMILSSVREKPWTCFWVTCTGDGRIWNYEETFEEFWTHVTILTELFTAKSITELRMNNLWFQAIVFDFEISSNE